MSESTPLAGVPYRRLGVWGMPQHHIKARKVARTALHAACGLGLVLTAICAGAGVARAGDDTMSSSTPFYDKIMQVIGLSGGSDIQYSERSPLVVPPTRDLPAPMADRAPAVPDWPKDPDMARTTAAKAKPQDRRPIPNYAVVDAMPLRPDQLNAPLASGRPTGSTSPGGVATPYDPDSGVQRQKTDLFTFFKNPFGSKTEYATFTGEPTRTSLTDPPAGYLTPSPDQPYGVGPEQKKYKIETVGDRVTPSSGSAAGN